MAESELIPDLFAAAVANFQHAASYPSDWGDGLGAAKARSVRAGTPGPGVDAGAPGRLGRHSRGADRPSAVPSAAARQSRSAITPALAPDTLVMPEPDEDPDVDRTDSVAG
jgi:hypothetical protein